MCAPRSVPCELWFFDKGKPEARRDTVLMIDARNIYRKVTRKVFDFSIPAWTPESSARDGHSRFNPSFDRNPVCFRGFTSLCWIPASMPK